MYLGAVGISHPYTARVGHMEYTYCVYVVLQVASLLAVHGGSAVAQVRFLTAFLGFEKVSFFGWVCGLQELFVAVDRCMVCLVLR